MRQSFIITILGILIILYSSIFIVQEEQRGIILRFGKILKDRHMKSILYSPGLHFKIPFIDSIKILDARIHTINNQDDHFVTIDKKELIINSYIKWRITNFSNYYLATNGGNTDQTETLLKSKFNYLLGSKISFLDAKSIITDSTGQLMLNIKTELNNNIINNKKKFQSINVNHLIFSKKQNFTQKLIDQNNEKIYLKSMPLLGIKIIDISIKQISLPTKVSNAIYQRMRSNFELIAHRLRSEGKEQAEKLRSTIDYKITHTLLEAEYQAELIRSEGDVKAAQLFSNTFVKDPEFYTFTRSLHAYEVSFNNNQNIMVLNTDSNFFRYMKLPSTIQKKMLHKYD
ncbi:Modulator of FtsH protease HflC [Candidatus Ecksteinia adelgidicola]|nr:Modulator of FtsH protease HflC [Candidatus Ecksteinia adelgidicola]